MEYLSDSITARIIKTISLLPRLRVKAHCLITRYKGKNLNPQEIGHDLNTQIVLTGIVFKIEDNLVVRTELIDVESGYHLWGAQYKRKLIDIFRVQEDITKEISKDLRTWLAKLIHQSSQ
ncbi:MAG: hypothetical protein ACRD4L_11830 [Pyrinomonadaceae bacterium]